MKQFKIWNNVLGWATFLAAALTYCLTVEPTASFWDCPEFILSGNKLEIGHPPGAPFFMLTANFFSLFATPDKVAYMVNIMSALLSAAGIMFLFWSITHLTRKLLADSNGRLSKAQMITVLASGIVGALAYTWSDTYWFSAVEGEVYGYSSLFTAVVFWLILKWEENADAPHSDRWLVLIAYLVGLSIGVHLLNLLCIPAIVLVVYYKKYPNASFKGSLLALAVSAAIVAVVLYGIVPGVVKVGGWFELLFVNLFGLPFNTGLYVYILLLFAAIVAGIYFTEKGKSQKLIAGTFTFAIALLGIPFYGNSVTGSGNHLDNGTRKRSLDNVAAGDTGSGSNSAAEGAGSLLQTVEGQAQDIVCHLHALFQLSVGIIVKATVEKTLPLDGRIVIFVGILIKLVTELSHTLGIRHCILFNLCQPLPHLLRNIPTLHCPSLLAPRRDQKRIK